MSLYRKYRPQKFEDVMDQGHVIQTLQGAIESKQIGHAYIFAGTRGTGKTSIARIFAKAVNCLSLKNNEPCGECSICKEIAEGRFLDLIEIDAASNRGIDEIRDLKEKIRFAPNIGKYKVYIIDEAHMLTDQAFNALLKTLEEPPAHAIFILATTEIHKIPITIFSRCQRLDFHKVKSQKMLEGIKKIIEKEGIKIDDKSLKKIVSISEGSVRDALSYLDQISAFANGEEIKFELIEDILGCSKEEKLVEFLNILAAKDIKQTISFINDFIEAGYDLENFIKDLIKFIRKILMAKIGNSSEEFFEDDKTLNLASNFSFEELLFLAELLNNVLKNNKFSFLPQLMLEIELIKFVNNLNLPKENKNENQSFSGKIVSEIKNVLKPSNIVKEKKEEANNEEKNEKTSEGKSSGWDGFLEKLKNQKIVLYMALQGCDFADEGETVNLNIYNGFYFNRLSEKTNRDFVEGVFKESFGDQKKLNIIKAEKKEDRRDLIKDALSVFGGELVE